MPEPRSLQGELRNTGGDDGLSSTAVRLHIRETTLDDLADLGRLWNDGHVMQWVGFPEGLGLEHDGLRDWFERLQSSGREHHFLIHEPDFGFCGELFYRIDSHHRRAELDVKLVPEAQGRGIATTGLSWLIQRIFTREPEVDAVWTEPVPDNAPSRALYARCGLAEIVRPDDLPPGPSYWEKRRRVDEVDRPPALG